MCRREILPPAFQEVSCLSRSPAEGKTAWGQGTRIPCGLFSSPPLTPAPADTLSCFPCLAPDSAQA